jgi:large subunit ribosomal protein L17
MRHRKNTLKLKRFPQHRDLMLANLVKSLIKHKRITTTVAKAKAARVLADKMVTLGKKGDLNAKRRVAAQLHLRRPSDLRTKEQRASWNKHNNVLRILFEEIAPAFSQRKGGYTRVLKLGPRASDAAEMALLEWTETITSKTNDQEPANLEKQQNPKTKN